LLTKLQARFPDQDAEIDEAIRRLQEHGLQSDERYAQMWLNGQVAKRRGPKRILFESKQKGVFDRIETLLSQSDYDWYQLALEAVDRKYPTGASYDDKGKIYRFLSYRGFSSDMIEFAYAELNQRYRTICDENSF
jgi:regulatory protein